MASLDSNEHALIEMIRQAAEQEPTLFLDQMLGFVLDAADATNTGDEEHGLPHDPHFAYRHESSSDMLHDAASALLVALTTCIEQSAAADPAAVRPILDVLAETRLDVAQWFLYKGLIAAGPALSDWAADLVLQDTSRLFCGYASNSVWVARELLNVFSATIDPERHQMIEDLVRDVRYPWEKGSGGWYAFNLLSALDAGRLSDVGRRRLGEYQRRFDRDQPPYPEGVAGGFFGSPIPSSAVPHMTDDHWLKAMERYQEDEHNWQAFTGGASELSQQMQEAVKSEPIRFARLATRLWPDLNPAYGDAILLGLGGTEPVADAEQEVVFEAVRSIARLGHEANDRWLAYALRHYFQTVPIDLVELIATRSVTSSLPVDDSPIVRREGGRRGEELDMTAMNSARGALAEGLGDLLIYDADGSRTAIAVAILPRLASDPVLAVRASAAHTVSATLRHARSQALASFDILLDADDDLLTSRHVKNLVSYVGNGNPALALPVLSRALCSTSDEVREAGGWWAALAALDWNAQEPLDGVLAGDDAAARRGAASALAARLPNNSNSQLAGDALAELFADPNEEVRKRAASCVVSLRDRALHPFASLLDDLITSEAFVEAVPQLFITLERAPDRVDDLALATARRFVDLYAEDIGNMSTGAAGDAHYVSNLIVRGLAQSGSHKKRAELLDILDDLLRLNVFGLRDAIDEAER
jgi:hypothetical protein